MSITLKRQYNRNLGEAYNRFIMPKAKLSLLDLAQKIRIYCKRNHTWQNRTGALEASIGNTEPEYKDKKWLVMVYAGGWAKAMRATESYGRGRRRITRYQRGQAFGVRRGAGIYVNYAKFVEAKGYPVLLQGIEHYRANAVKMFRENLKVRLPQG